MENCDKFTNDVQEWAHKMKVAAIERKIFKLYVMEDFWSRSKINGVVNFLHFRTPADFFKTMKLADAMKYIRAMYQHDLYLTKNAPTNVDRDFSLSVGFVAAMLANSQVKRSVLYELFKS